MNIVVPGKLLAFSGPNTSSELPDGYPAFTPACFAPIFRKWNVTGVVRLNKKTYDRREFTSRVRFASSSVTATRGLAFLIL
jgi:cell division cycle 14